jgi:uncharacterized membrane protein
MKGTDIPASRQRRSASFIALLDFLPRINIMHDAIPLSLAALMNVVAILVAGLMVGCELAIAAFIHPTLDKLPKEAHLPAASAIARVLGTVMPFWYNLTLLLTLGEVVFRWHQSGRFPIAIATSAVLWMLAIVYSLIALVPVNNRIKSWEKSAPPPDWKTFRSRWDRHHRWRVVVLTAAFAFLIAGIVS